MENNTKKILLFGLGLSVLVFCLFLFLQFSGFFPNSEFISGTIDNGYIERDDLSFKGEYQAADGEWKYSFVLEKGNYVIDKKIDTKSGEIKIEVENEQHQAVANMADNNSFVVEKEGTYHLNFQLAQHSGGFTVEIKKQ